MVLKDQAFTLRKMLLGQSKQQLPNHCIAIMSNSSKLGYGFTNYLVNVSRMHELSNAILYTTGEFEFQETTNTQIGFSSSMWLALAQGRIEHLLSQHLKPHHLNVDCWFLQMPVLAWPVLLRLNKTTDVIWFAEPNHEMMRSMIHGVNTSTGVDANIRHHVIVACVNDHDEGRCVFDSLLQKFSVHSVKCVEYAGWLPMHEDTQNAIRNNVSHLNWPEFTASYCTSLLDKVLARLPIAT